MFDKKVTLILSAAVIITAGLLSGYYFYNKEIISEDNKLILQNNTIENIKNFTRKNEISSISENTQNVSDTQKQKTNENTKIIYEYYYKDDEIIKRKANNLPPELVNKPREVIEDVFDEWSVVTFNEDEIVLRKDIEGTKETDYLLKEYDGFVAVFYEQNQELKEMTSTPIKSLPEEEQTLLKKGISIRGNENLLKILQDYES